MRICGGSSKIDSCRLVVFREITAKNVKKMFDNRDILSDNDISNNWRYVYVIR